MKLHHLAAVAALISLVCAAPAAAQQQLPSAIGPGGSAVQTQASAPVVAPAGGGQGTGCVVSPDACPLPTAQIFVDFSASPTVTASSAYASGNVVGSVMTFNAASLAAGQGGRIEEVTLYSKSAQTGEIDFVWCGSQQPTGSTVTDKTALSIAAADFDKCRTVAQLTNWTPFGTVSVATSGQLATPFVIGTGTAGYGFLVARSTPTFSSTSDLKFVLRVGR